MVLPPLPQENEIDWFGKRTAFDNELGKLIVDANAGSYQAMKNSTETLTRVKALETLGGITPGNVTDSSMTLVSLQRDSAFRAVQNSLMVSRVEATAGHNITDPTLAHTDGPAKLVPLPTYDNSGVACHPSVYFNPGGWNGYKYWMAMTPYTSANNQVENPSILASNDGDTWVVPPGLTNPIEPPPGKNPQHPGEGGYHSDPYLSMANDGTLYCFWRSIINNRERLYYRISVDGSVWSNRFEEWNYAYDPANPSDYRIMAPSVIQMPDNSWVFYGVDILNESRTPRAARRIVRRTADKLGGTWSSVKPVTVTNKVVNVGGDGDPWHVDVQRVGGEWHMLVMDGGANGGKLWAAISQDGTTFKAGPSCVDFTEWAPKWYKSCFIPAVKDGVFGWDTWVGGASFIASGTITGRTFIRFDSNAKNVTMLESKIRDSMYSPFIEDDFSRANGVLKTNDYPWVIVDGTFSIIDNSAGLTNASNSRAVINANVNSHSVSAVFTKLAPSSTMSLVAGWTDVANHYRFGILFGVLKLEKIENMVVTKTVTASGAPVTAGARLEVAISKGMVRGYVDGQLVATMDETATPPSGTFVGFQSSSIDARYNKFVVRVEVKNVVLDLVKSQSEVLMLREGLSVLQAINGVPPWIASDIFNRSDTTTLGVSSSGKTWTNIEGGFQIQNRLALPTIDSRNNMSYLDVERDDYWATITVAPRLIDIPQMWLFYRYTDRANFMRLGCAGGVWSLQNVTDNVVESVWTNKTELVNIPNNTFGIKVSGYDHTVYINGKAVTTVSNDTHPTGTKLGLQSPNLNAKVSAITVRTV